MVLHLVLGDDPLFHVSGYRLVHPAEFAVYAVLGVVGGLGSVCFVKLLLGLRAWFMRLPKWTVWFQPVAGGLTVGLMGYFVPEVLGVGYNHVEKVLNGDIVLKLVVLLCRAQDRCDRGLLRVRQRGRHFWPGPVHRRDDGRGGRRCRPHVVPRLHGGPRRVCARRHGNRVRRNRAYAADVGVHDFRDHTRLYDHRSADDLQPDRVLHFVTSSREQPIYEALAYQEGVHLPTAHSRSEAERIQVRKAMRSAPAVLSPDLPDCGSSPSDEERRVRCVARRRRGWPVGNDPEQRGRTGRSRGSESNKKVAEILGEASRSGPSTAEELPHVHPDHSLSLALERMGTSGLNVLPVVSRANVRQLIGIIVLDDILNAYGVAKRGSGSGARPIMAKPFAGRSFLGTFGLVFLAIAALFVVDTFLAKTERAESLVEAARLFEQGRVLMQRGENAEAIERIKDAISIERGNRDYLRTLAQAQFAAGKTADAESTLTELLQSDSTDGLASLIMARVLVKEERFAEAISYFHRAIYGRWNEDAAENRLRARFELIDLLAQRDSKEELLAELLPIQDQLLPPI